MLFSPKQTVSEQDKLYSFFLSNILNPIYSMRKNLQSSQKPYHIIKLQNIFCNITFHDFDFISFTDLHHVLASKSFRSSKYFKFVNWFVQIFKSFAHIHVKSLQATNKPKKRPKNVKFGSNISCINKNWKKIKVKIQSFTTLAKLSWLNISVCFFFFSGFTSRFWPFPPG